MKHQALFSWKDKSKKLKCHLLQFLFGPLRVNWTFALSVTICYDGNNKDNEQYFCDLSTN